MVTTSADLWPDQPERERWAGALAAAAARIERERGLTVSARLRVRDGALHARYGSFEVAVAGSGGRVSDQDELS